jgi:hypothetical protein
MGPANFQKITPGIVEHDDFFTSESEDVLRPG